VKINLSKPKKLIFCSIIIFLTVFISYAIAIKGNWFGVDDLGYILNGLIKNVKDFFRVFTEDSRYYSRTYNYNYPLPNLFSGFLRPLQQIPLSITYHLFGPNPYAFGLLHVLFHSINSMLLFILFSNWLPISFSFLGSMLFAFYPDMSWLTWMCTLQSSLSLFFLIISILLFLRLLKKIKKEFYKEYLFYFAGFAFLLSLLSRETHIFLPAWAFLGIYISRKNKSHKIWVNIKHSLSKTWIFFVSTSIYMLIRINAFGLASLSRTGRNLLIRFNFLEKIFSKAKPIIIQKSETISNTATTIHTTLAKHTTSSSIPLITKFYNFSKNFSISFFEWIKRIFNAPAKTQFDKLLLLTLFVFFVTFLIFAYRKNKKILLLFICGIPLFVWPCILIYPDVRYMNSTYPLLIFILLLGLYFFIKNKSSCFIKKLTVAVVLILLGTSIYNGLKQNIISKALAKKTDYRENIYYQFFKENNFKNNPSFIFFSSKEEPDLERRLQVVSGNFNIKAAFTLLTRISVRKNNFDGYHIKQIKNGYRLTSLDENNCLWEFRYRQPCRWSKKEKAYVLFPTFFRKDTWYEFSMGKFMIHKIKNKKHVTDFSIIFYKKWIDKNTIFVVWNTKENKYEIINSDHLKK
jgi:hypothetical protein